MCFFAAAGAGAALGGLSIGSSISAITSLAAIPLSIMQAQAQNAAAMAQYQEQVRFRQEQGVQLQKTLNQQVAQQQMALESQKGKAQGESANASIEGYKAQSTAQVGAAESGIVGLSVDALMASIGSEESRFQGSLRYNTKMGIANAQNELKMAERGSQARLAEIPIPVRPQFNTGLQIGSAVLSGLGNFGKAIG